MIRSTCRYNTSGTRTLPVPPSAAQILPVRSQCCLELLSKLPVPPSAVQRPPASSHCLLGISRQRWRALGVSQEDLESTGWYWDCTGRFSTILGHTWRVLGGLWTAPGGTRKL